MRTSSDPNGIANGVKGQPILQRLKTYSEKLPLYELSIKIWC